MIPLILNDVYYVEYSDRPVENIAIRPTISIQDNRISWPGTSSHGSSFPIDKIIIDGKEVKEINPDDTPHKIEIISPSGKRCVLEKMTRKIFEEKLKDEVISGLKMDFKNDQEVQDFYLNTNFEKYHE